MSSLAGAYLSAASQAEWLDRINRLAPDARPHWGSMNPTALLAHLRRSIELSLGEVQVKDESIPVVRTLLRWLSFSLPLPWPKGKIKAPPVFFPEQCATFDVEKRQLAEALERFTRALAANPNRIELSPLFGPMPLKTWGRIHGRHMEHHCRQYGL